MEFKSLISKALKIRKKYAVFETKKYGREWTREELLLGLLGDVGDLAKLIQAKEGVRIYPDLDQKLAHELSDCLWSVIILAQKYDIDLETAFITTMNEIEAELEA